MKRKIILAGSSLVLATLSFFGVKAMAHKTPVNSYFYRLTIGGTCSPGSNMCTTVAPGAGACQAGAVLYYLTAGCTSSIGLYKRPN